MTVGPVVAKANPLLNSLPRHLTWRGFNFRTFCSGKLGFMSDSTSRPPSRDSAGMKIPESFKEEFKIGNRLISFETGKYARFANGAVVMGIEETKVLSTVASSKGDAMRDFLPLTVDYQEKQYAQGVIPNTYLRREGPKERELLCGRLIDRSIRPLFPSGFYHEVQVNSSVLSSDGKQDPDVMAVNATSAALMLSDIPWGGPIGVVRIGRICGQFIINPSMDELSLSDLNLVYACTKDKTMMIDVQAYEISEKDLEAGLRFAHPEAVKYLEPQVRLAAKAGRQMKEYKLSMMSEAAVEKIRNLSEAQIEAIFTDSSYGKFERGEALDKITQGVKKSLEEEECDEEILRVLPKAVDTVKKQVVRRRVIKEGLRVDGRQLDEVRPVFCEAGNLPALIGSSLFSRGETQVLCTVTLGAPGETQHLDSVVGPSSKHFMLHYSLPPFSINEVGKRVGLNSWEVGHGMLAEKALLAVVQPEDEFCYTVRINAEVMASDDSSLMASVCGVSMALMDAGIPLREHVAGVSVGLVSEVDPVTGDIQDYRILTDILGLEDHLGDMDFKIAGTRKGVTAVQLDIKPAGIPLDIICESLKPAFKARSQILDRMEHEINLPRAQDDKFSPQIATLKFNSDSIRRLIGPLGTVKRKMEEETGARISIGDDTVTIIAKNQSIMEKAQEKIDFTIRREIEVGGVYKGIVTSVKEYGAFVEFNGGQHGLLPISELSRVLVSRVSDVLSVGQQLNLICIGQDVRGNIMFSLKRTSFPRSGRTRVVDRSPTYVQENPTEQPLSKCKLKKRNVSAFSVPSFLIRSAEECVEQEASSCLNKNDSDEGAAEVKSASKKGSEMIRKYLLLDIKRSPTMLACSRIGALLSSKFDCRSIIIALKPGSEKKGYYSYLIGVWTTNASKHTYKKVTKQLFPGVSPEDFEPCSTKAIGTWARSLCDRKNSIIYSSGELQIDQLKVLRKHRLTKRKLSLLNSLGLSRDSKSSRAKRDKNASGEAAVTVTAKNMKIGTRVTG